MQKKSCRELRDRFYDMCIVYMDAYCIEAEYGNTIVMRFPRQTGFIFDHAFFVSNVLEDELKNL